jgi:hypothetical protein
MDAGPVRVERMTVLSHLEVHDQGGLYDYVLARPIVLRPGDRYWVDERSLYVQRGDGQAMVVESDVAPRCVRLGPTELDLH